MCTLLYQPLSSDGCRAALGLNRDEEYARPAAPPRWWPPDDAPGAAGTGFVAPVDLRAGGTWFGLGERGLFAAITNGRPSDWQGAFRHERSRGELVVDALRLGEIRAAAANLAARDAAAYAPCHLLLAQGAQAAYVAPDRDPTGGFVVRWLSPGPHTLTNGGLDRGDTPDFALAPDSAAEDVIGALHRALTTHTGPTARCRHGADRGTRSSAIVLLGDDLASSRLLYAEGRPCTTPYVDVEVSRLSAAPGTY
jgi:uncharacterized protein with NRDE domain